MTEDVPAADVFVTEDMLCVHCGYNVRGLPVDGRCPECGTPVSWSLRGDLLRHADPEWLDRLRLGTVLKLWNIVLGIGLGIVGAILVSVGVPQWMLLPLGVLGGVLGLCASFAITTQEPRISLQEDTVTLRKVVRVFAVLAFLGTVSREAAEGIALGPGPQIAATLLQVAGVVAWVGELVYFRRFARRIPDESLARQTGVVLWASSIGLGLMLVFGVAVALITGAAGATGTTTAPSPGGMTLLVGPICVVSVLAVVFMIWYVALLFRYRSAFAHAAAQSRAESGAGENTGAGW
jgi:hypothetical protein